MIARASFVAAALLFAPLAGAREEDADARNEETSAPSEEGASTADTTPEKTVYTLEGIEIRGNERTLSRVISALLPWSPGDRLDPEDRRLLRARYRLLATGYFRDVELSLRRGSRRGRVVLVVAVRERNTLVIESLVAGVGAREGSDGRASPIGPFAGLELV